MTKPVPESVGRFAILGRLGSGGMGEVYAASDPALERKVALKRLLPGHEADEETRRRLLHEARSAARVRHQNIAALHDVIDADGELWLVMEHVEGRTLQQVEHPLPVERMLTIAEQCARGLAAAHRQGVVHGDIKPGNVMVDDSGEVKILDFGVAGMTVPVSEDDATMTRPWQAPGSGGATVGYAAPEVLLGRETDHRADLFSLGVVLYELLTGGNPFAADSRSQTADRTLHATPTPIGQLRPEVPAELARVIDKLLSKDPRARYATTDDLIVDLKAARRHYGHPETQPVLDPGTAPGDAVGPFVSSADAEAALGTRWGWVVAAVLAVVVLAALSSPWWPRRESSSAGPGQPGATVAVDAPGQVVAVLPAADVDERDPDVAALSRGVVSILTARLAQVSRTRDLQVLPSSLLEEFEISGLEEAHREMGVTLAVQVDARRVGEEVRITTNLVDTAARRQVDGDTLVGHLDDAIDLEEQVSLRVMRMLHLRLQPGEEALAAGTSEPRAYALYVQGRGYLAEYDDPEAIESAVQLFQRSLDIDPGFASAHAGLGEALWRRYEHSNDSTWVEQALDQCRAAAAIDDASPASHVCLGTVYRGTGRTDDAVQEFQRATTLDPNLDTALLGLASAYEDSGRLDLAEATYKEAIEARPRYWAGYNRLGTFYNRRGRYEEAAAAFREVVDMAPDNYVGLSNLGVVYYNLEQWEDARRTFERAVEVRPDGEYALSNLATLAFFEGDYAESARRFEQLLAVDDSEYWLWGYLADALYWHAQTGGADQGTSLRERAIEAYRRAIELGEQALKVNPNDGQVLREVAVYHAMVGEDEPARRLIGRALDVAADDVDTQVWAAKVFAQLGDRDQALEHLRRAVDAGYPRAEIRAEPVFESLADDAAFRGLTEEP